MQGTANSTIVITAGLAMVTAASFLWKAERERKEREREQRRKNLKRQISTASRSKTDREVPVLTKEVLIVGGATSSSADASFETQATDESSIVSEEPVAPVAKDDSEWKGMVAFLILVLLWGICVTFLPVALGIKPLDEAWWMTTLTHHEVVVVEPRKWWQVGKN